MCHHRWESQFFSIMSARLWCDSSLLRDVTSRNFSSVLLCNISESGSVGRISTRHCALLLSIISFLFLLFVAAGCWSWSSAALRMSTHWTDLHLVTICKIIILRFHIFIFNYFCTLLLKIQFDKDKSQNKGQQPCPNYNRKHEKWKVSKFKSSKG